MFDILKLEELHILQKRLVHCLVRVQKHEHAWAQQQLVVVFKIYVLNYNGTILFLLEPKPCLAATSFSVVHSMPLGFANICSIHALAGALKVSVVTGICLSLQSIQTVGQTFL